MPARLAGALLAIVASAPPDMAAFALDADGSTLERAIVIEETTTAAGIAAEGAYIHRVYPGWRRTQQALSHMGGRSYDRLVIVSPSGARRAIFFDITSFFGRM